MTDPAPGHAALRHVLLTGFEPFGGDAVNPSGAVAQALNGTPLAGHLLVGVTLPTAFAASVERLHQLLGQIQPVLVVCTGVAKGRTGLALERVALNLLDAPLPDNAGQQPVDQPVRPGAPPAHFSGLPVKAMQRALHAHGHAAELSLSAGSYVCNAVFFELMEALATRPEHRGVVGGFIHLPALPAQHPTGPSMALADQVAAVAVAIEAALAHAQPSVPGGAR